MKYKVTYFLTSGKQTIEVNSKSSFKDFCQNEIKAIDNAKSSSKWYVTGDDKRFYFNPENIIGVGFEQINNGIKVEDVKMVPLEKPQTITDKNG